jgi:GT2 family glycosyltransferase
MLGIVGLGANMSIKKEMTDKFGLFDEHIGAGASIPAGEDWDLVYRALAAGYTVYDTNSVKVWHNGWRDFQETIRTMRNYRKGDAAFFMKYTICGDFRSLIILAATTFETTFYTLYAGLIRPSDRQPIKLPDSFLKKCYFLIFWFCHPLVDTIWGIFQAFQFSIDKNNKVFIKKK